MTRDPDILEKIIEQHRYIKNAYGLRDEEGVIKGLTWNYNDRELTDITAILDQLNAYMILIIPYLSGKEATQWKKTLKLLCNSLL